MCVCDMNYMKVCLIIFHYESGLFVMHTASVLLISTRQGRRFKRELYVDSLISIFHLQMNKSVTI